MELSPNFLSCAPIPSNPWEMAKTRANLCDKMRNMLFKTNRHLCILEGRPYLLLPVSRLWRYMCRTAFGIEFILKKAGLGFASPTDCKV